MLVLPDCKSELLLLSMLPTLHTPDKQVSPKHRVEGRPAEARPEKKKVTEHRPERAGMSYEDYIAGEMGNVVRTPVMLMPI